ncbi:MAG: hypothetical protein ACYDD1_11140 [Caulobacteraceae bacterium]
MATDMQLRDAHALLLGDWSDEMIEEATGLGLLDISGLRAGEAVALGVQETLDRSA